MVGLIFICYSCSLQASLTSIFGAKMPECSILPLLLMSNYCEQGES